MAPALSACEPTAFVAGDTVAWTKTLGDYPPSDGWVLSYSIRGPSVITDNTVEVADDGTTFTVTLPATITQGLEPGSYHYSARVSRGVERYTVAVGTVQVARNLATAGVLITHDERMLAAIEAVLESRITADVVSYTIEGRSVTKLDPSELRKWHAYYLERVAAARHRGRRATIKVGFGAP